MQQLKSNKKKLKTSEGSNLKSRNLQHIILKAQKGDAEAFNSLVNTFHKPLLGYLLSSLYFSDKSQVEDLAQDIWSSLWHDINQELSGKINEEYYGYDAEKGSFFTFLIQRYAKFWLLRYKGKLKKTALEQQLTLKDKSGEDKESEFPDPDQLNPLQSLEFKEERKLQFLANIEFFRLLFLCGGFPHQQLAFIFSRLAYGTSSKRGIEGKPREVDSKYGEFTLQELLKEFWKVFYREVDLDTADYRYFYQLSDPLVRRLELPVKVLFKSVKPLRKQLEKIHNLEERVKSTCLRDYYLPRGFTTALPLWSDSVKKRLAKILNVYLEVKASDFIKTEDRVEKIAAKSCNKASSGKKILGLCSYCKLKHVPPCSENY